jgi:hypothetical protein
MEGKSLEKKVSSSYKYLFKGCPRLPALGFDLKVSIESVNLCEKIPTVRIYLIEKIELIFLFIQYITANYQENGEKYTSECEQINRLRQVH